MAWPSPGGHSLVQTQETSLAPLLSLGKCLWLSAFSPTLDLSFVFRVWFFYLRFMIWFSLVWKEEIILGSVGVFWRGRGRKEETEKWNICTLLSVPKCVGKENQHRKINIPWAEVGEISNTVWRCTGEKTSVGGWWDYEAAQWGSVMGGIWV